MRGVLICVLALAACADAAGPGACTRPDVGTPCSQGSTATLRDGVWSVVIRQTVRQGEEYRDGGFVCSRTVTSCRTKECHYHGGATMTQAEAIARCGQQ
jgi:hypothetical protein